MNIAKTVVFKSGEEVSIMPLSCLHWPLTDKTTLRAWVKRVQQLAATGQVRVVLLGDQFEGFRTSFRKFLATYAADQNSVTTIDELMETIVDDLVTELAPIRSVIMGVIQGNHYYQMYGAITSDQILCQKLKVPFLGAESMIRLHLKQTGPKGLNKAFVIKIACHHHGGSKGAQTAGGRVNQLQKWGDTWDADLVLLGHTHDVNLTRKAFRSVADRGAVTTINKERVYARCGCTRARLEDKTGVNLPYNPDYTTIAGLGPLPVSWAEIHYRAYQPHRSSYMLKVRTVEETP